MCICYFSAMHTILFYFDLNVYYFSAIFTVFFDF